jgi:cupin fold WbuC family metalloprotein
MIRIDEALLDQVSARAAAVPRLRMNHNFHQNASDRLHRMLNAMEPGTYIQPHKHENPDKNEAFFCLRGRLLVVEYDDSGNIVDHIILDSRTANYGCELPPRTWHSIISLEAGSVAYEVKDGPWNPADDKHFAEWAPAEGDEDVDLYISNVLKTIGVELTA